MKRYCFNIISGYKDLFFPKERIKSKNKILDILLEVTRYILYEPLINEDEASNDRIVLIVDKMSRLFFSTTNKTYSIVFPFDIHEDEEGRFKFTFAENRDVDAQLISDSIRIMNSEEFKSPYIMDAAILLDKEDQYVWTFIRELMRYEDGYIRYDIDQKGFENADAKGCSKKHPLEHYDLFYTNKATFKVGIEKSHDLNKFIDLVDVKTDCNFLKK